MTLLLVADAVWGHDGVDAVRVAEDRITHIGRAAELPTMQQRRDFPGATILPGLVDAHVHMSLDASSDPVAALPGAARPEALATRGRALLRGGVTTARDLGDYHRSVLRTAFAGPRVIGAGVPLTCPGGHCHFLGGEVSPPTTPSGLSRPIWMRAPPGSR